MSVEDSDILRRRLAIHCDDLNLLYLCTAKTGSTSVSNALLEQLGGRWIPRDHIWEGDRLAVDFKHSSLAELVEYELFDEATIRSMNVAITVRNPFAWVLSGYRYRQRVHEQVRSLGDAVPQWMVSRRDDIDRAAGVGFDEYVHHEIMSIEGAPASVCERYVAGFEDHDKLTYLRIESIDDELNTYLRSLGVGWHIEFPHDNATSGPGYRHMYSEESRALVESTFAGDLVMFDYHF